MYRNSKLALAAALALGVAIVPAQAQKFSDSFSFLKAVKERNGAEAETLLVGSSPAVVNTRDSSSGDGGLHIVVRGRDYGWLSFLLSKGAKPDLQNKDGNTPLGLASQLGWQEGAALLLRVGANVDLPNNRGETPLIFAVQKRDAAMVRMLLAKGADPKRTDNSAGYSALDYAKQDGRAAAILRLLEAPAKPGREVAGPPR